MFPPPGRSTTNSSRPAPRTELPPTALDSMSSAKQPPDVHPTPQHHDLVQHNRNAQQQWPMYLEPHDVNLFYVQGTFDFLNTMTKPEDGLGDNTAVSSILDLVPGLHQDTSQAGGIGVSGGGPVMLNVDDIPLSHTDLAGYTNGYDTHFMLSQQPGVRMHDKNGVLNSVFGTTGSLIDDISHTHPSLWDSHATTIHDGVSSGFSPLSSRPTINRCPCRGSSIKVTGWRA